MKYLDYNITIEDVKLISHKINFTSMERFIDNHTA